MGPTAAGCGGIVVALEGDVAELTVLEAAAAGRELLDVPVSVVWVAGGRRRPAGPLLAEIAAEAGFASLPRDEVAALLDRDRVRLVVIGRHVWVRWSERLWRRLRSSPLLITGEGSLPPRRVLCGADTPETASALLARVPGEDLQVAVVHGDPPPPSWAESLCGLYGFALPPPQESHARGRTEWGSAQIMGWTKPADAVVAGTAALAPDLVVLGWHRHRLPLPGRWLHPTAWRLSRELSSHVLLVPLSS